MQVTHDRAKVGTNITRSTVKAPWAPCTIGLVWDLAAPMAILNHDWFATIRAKDVIPKLHVCLGATAVKLVTIKPKGPQCFGIAFIELPVTALLVAANTIVAIPASSQTQFVRVISHVLHVWEAVIVDDRISICIVVVVTVGPALAILPIIIETYVT